LQQINKFVYYTKKDKDFLNSLQKLLVSKFITQDKNSNKKRDEINSSM